MPKPMHSNIFAAVETLKCPFDNSLSDSDPNTMLISNETKWGRALYKPFCFDKIISKMVFCYQKCFKLLLEKKNSGDRKFVKFLTSLEQFIQAVKGQNNIW